MGNGGHGNGGQGDGGFGDGAARMTAPPDQRQEKRQPRGRRQPRKVSPDYLERAALHYLERYASSSANLRRLLTRKVDLSAKAHGTDPEEGRRWVEALVERFRSSGLLDDKAYAEMKASGLQRRGGSTRTIRMKLGAKGVDADLIDAALGGLEGAETGRADLAAAVAYARRRRLGPFRAEADRAGRRDKDLAALARAGFDYDTARQVVDAVSREDLEG